MRRRSTVRLSPQDIDEGYALACQTVVESDLVVTIPPQEKIERRLKTDKTAAKIALPFPYDAGRDQPLRKIFLRIEPPNLADNTDDLSRLQRELARRSARDACTTDLPVVRTHGAHACATAEWDVTAVLEAPASGGAAQPICWTWSRATRPRSCGALAIDIGTTTVTVYLVDLHQRRGQGDRRRLQRPDRPRRGCHLAHHLCQQGQWPAGPDQPGDRHHQPPDRPGLPPPGHRSRRRSTV